MNELNNQTEMDAEELTLAPETELHDEAKRIAAESAGKETASFIVEFDKNYDEELLALISEMGSAVEGEEEKTGALILSLNEDQLAFVKTLDYVERLRESRPMVRQVAEEPMSLESMTVAAEPVTMSLDADDGGVAMASEVATASVTSTCPESNTMATAIPLTIGTVKYGCICCPGAEQWYKFTVNESSTYTISTNKFTENYNLDTVGYLYDSCGNLLAQNDDHNLRLYFKIQAELEEGQTYYVKVKAKGNNTGAYCVKVENKIWVTDVTVHPATVIMGVGDTAQLSATVYPANATEKRVMWISFNNNVATVDFNTGEVTAVGVGTADIRAYDWDERSLGAQCAVYVGGPPVESVTLDRTKKTISVGDSEYLIETILPLTAIERRVHWESSNSSIATVNGAGLVTAKAPGTANITVRTVDGGYTATCVVTVDSREKVAVERDDEGGYRFFKATFNNGLIWESVGVERTVFDGPLDLAYQSHFRRANANATREYSDQQLAFLYRLDPLGVEYYVNTHTIGENISIAQMLEYRDRIYKAIFGEVEDVQGRFRFKISNGDVIYGHYTGDRTDYYTNAEVLFGSHLIPDWSGFWNGIATMVFGLIPGTSALQLGVEVFRGLFFSGSLVETANGAASDFFENYCEDYMDTTNDSLRSLLFGWPRVLCEKLLELADLFVDAITPENINDITLYSSVDSHSNYRLVFHEVPLSEIIGRCNDR